MSLDRFDDEIDIDALQEIRDVLEYAIECRRWTDVEEALEMLNDLLGQEDDSDELEE